MNELALIETLVQTIDAEAAGFKVSLVELEVGVLAPVTPSALRFCFETCVRGTRLACARLELVDAEARLQCSVCGDEHVVTRKAVAQSSISCTCGAAHFDVLAGDQLEIKHIELSNTEPEDVHEFPQ